MVKKTGKLFVSHAGDDEKYVTSFVEKILQLGCKLDPEKVFYSSRRGMGIPSGSALFETMRVELDKSPLVVAVISPTYLTRPTCVAEMGAAWARQTLFPVLTPGVTRESLTGPLTSLLIEQLDQHRAGDVLDELFDKVREVFGLSSTTMMMWTPQKATWLAGASKDTSLLGTPKVYTADDISKLTKDLESRTQDYDAMVEAYGELENRFNELKAARTKKQHTAALMPKGEVAQFEQLSGDLVKYFTEKRLQRCVIKAIRYHVTGKELLLPDIAHDVDNENPDFSAAEDQGYLSIDTDPAEVRVNEEHPRIRGAIVAADAFVEWFDSPSRTDEFKEWFADKYDLPVDSKNSDVWDDVLIP